jgi:peptidoglycan/xylan/chitin deacetylase (PgdA/CDA1 family)/endo-1,4-beta-D-glucanase Y
MLMPSRVLLVGSAVAALVLSLSGAVPAGASPSLPSAAAAPPPLTVSLQFDDGRGQAEAARILDRHHIPATFFVNTGYTGTGDGYFTWKELHDLAARGHEIAGHTLTHRDLATLSLPEQRREICGDRQSLVSHGFAATDFAYPFGSYTDATEKIVRECGYSSGRAAWGLWGSGCEDDPSTCPYAVDPAHLDDRWAIPTAEAPIDLTTVYDLEQVVVNAEQHGGGWVQIFFHRICADDCDEYSWAPEQLDAFTTWLAAREGQGTVTRTTQQVLSSPAHPAVAPPAAPAPPRGTNLLRNPSFTAVDGAGAPRCWERTGGTSWSRPLGPHGRAEQVTSSGAPDGYAALAQPQDQGECAAGVYPGLRLTMSLAYRSTSRPRLAVWVRNDAGGWRFWRSGPTLAPTRVFRRATWVLPSIPAHVSAVSVGVTQAGEGRVAVDDVALRRVGPVSGFPFGSHRQTYVRGTLRPSGSVASLDAATVAVYRKWKAAFVRNRCGHGWYEVYSPDADHPYVGEGQGYGMVVTASMAGADTKARTIFDGLVAYLLAHPSVHNHDLLAAEQDSRCVSVNGSDSATDGDLDVAYGLLLADKQWGSKGRYNYKALALRHIRAIKANEINPRTHLLTLGDWSHPGESHWWMTRSSDWMADHFRAFRRATGDRGWGTILTAHQRLIRQLQTSFAPDTGLLPDFVVDTSTSPRPAPSEVLESPDDGHYSWNACRDPWRIGVDAITSGDSGSVAAVRLLTTWVRSATSGHPERIASTYRLDGSVVDPSHDAAFIAPFAVAAMSDPTAQPWLDAIWRNLVRTPVDPSSYYSASIQLQTMIVASGNYLRV